MPLTDLTSVSLPFRSRLFVKLGVTTVASFAVLFGPLVLAGEFGQVVHRIFPFARGIFEDKVANFWVSLTPFSSIINVCNLVLTVMNHLPP
jgi:hypothetical protein